MKKKKLFLFCLVIIFSVLLFVFVIVLSNNKRSINRLISQLEHAINEHNIEKIIDLYPDYCKSNVIKYFSQDRLNEFYDNVIKQDNKDIKVQILNVSNFETSSCDDIRKQILDDYHYDVEIKDYQLVHIKYHDDFGESNLEVIKIDGEYYLYFCGYIGEPLSYFH